jgi:hypothetical protein
VSGRVSIPADLAAEINEAVRLGLDDRWQPMPGDGAKALLLASAGPWPMPGQEIQLSYRDGALAAIQTHHQDGTLNESAGVLTHRFWQRTAWALVGWVDPVDGGAPVKVGDRILVLDGEPKAIGGIGTAGQRVADGSPQNGGVHVFLPDVPFSRAATRWAILPEPADRDEGDVDWLEEARLRRLTDDRAELTRLQRIYWNVCQVRHWTNEDGKRFVFADDLAEALEIPSPGDPA